MDSENDKIMDSRTVIKAMKLVLDCDKIGTPAAIFAALAIAEGFQVEFEKSDNLEKKE